MGVTLVSKFQAAVSFAQYLNPTTDYPIFPKFNKDDDLPSLVLRCREKNRGWQRSPRRDLPRQWRARKYKRRRNLWCAVEKDGWPVEPLYSKGIFESVGGGGQAPLWIMPPCSQDGIISRPGKSGDPIRCIDATIPQGFSMGLRKIRPVERNQGVLVWECWIEIEEN